MHMQKEKNDKCYQDKNGLKIGNKVARVANFAYSLCNATCEFSQSDVKARRNIPSEERLDKLVNVLETKQRGS